MGKDAILLINVTDEQSERITELRDNLTEDRFNCVLMEWINKLLIEIALSDGGLFIVD